MSKCKRCNRELKNHTESGMGEICRMKADRLNNSDLKTVRVEPLFIRRSSRRSYLVFTSPRVVVVVEEESDGRFAFCPCSPEMCEHRRLVAEIDRAAFPVDLFAPANNVIAFPVQSPGEKEEFHYQAGAIELHYENVGYEEAA